VALHRSEHQRQQQTGRDAVHREERRHAGLHGSARGAALHLRRVRFERGLRRPQQRAAARRSPSPPSSRWRSASASPPRSFRSSIASCCGRCRSRTAISSST
jgi:hypothetical protein